MCRCLGKTYPNQMGCLHSVRSLYVTLKEFTPDLQIFYTFFVFGLNVQVSGVMKSAVFIKLYQMSKVRMSLAKFLPQTSKKFTQIYLLYLWHYATLLYPYTAKRRDVLENTPPEAQEISQGPRGAKSPSEGNLEGRGGVFSNASRLEAVYGHSFSISREVLILWCDNRWREH